ncbi:PD-(D/E)XK nuclease family protein [Flavobacterium sp.]|uniref:PDDEXK-like family protein n=1 Tax=Flavobacterium sp. TaxID=239 RepID=UPI001210C68C|nr:PD-(D/E)XK nuclease family protein [Flavobacterium sp.]RZJ69216.1 MAG: hypothetical protein EOO49_18130 [Flavobacterium sp.]
MENIHQINQLLNETQTISESYKRVADSTGENFNIFSILQMESDEVGTHSRFLAELLNRKGRHGQKDKFVKLFLNRFAPDHIFRTEKSETYVEFHVGKVAKEAGGRIDILLRDTDGNVVMIENKIYAGEQYNQLLRYRNAFPSGKLLYLTLFGDDSAQKNAHGLYFPLSYETDIIEWLEDCRKESVAVPILRETISQYINLLKKLTHQNLNKKMNQDIISRILRDNASLDSFRTLFDLHKDLKKEIIASIVSRIKQMFEERGFENIQTMDFSKDKGRLISFETPALKERGLRFQMNFEGSNYSGLLLGFVNPTASHPKDAELIKMVKAEFPKAQQSDWWNVFLRYEEYRDWYFAGLSKIYFDEDDAFYSDLANKVDRIMAVFNERVNGTIAVAELAADTFENPGI